MSELGFDQFSVAGHDRGGRVAYRLALDHPDRITRLAVLDIVPGADAWDRADARFVTRNGRKPDGLRKDTRLEQPIRQRIGRRAVAGNHRSNRALADARVESKPREPLFEETCVVPQPFHDLRLFHEHINCGDTCRRHRGRMGCRKEKRARPMVEKLDQIAVPGHVPAECTNRL